MIENVTLLPKEIDLSVSKHWELLELPQFMVSFMRNMNFTPRDFGVIGRFLSKPKKKKNNCISIDLGINYPNRKTTQTPLKGNCDRACTLFTGRLEPNICWRMSMSLTC